MAENVPGVVLFKGGADPLKAGPGAILTILIDAMTQPVVIDGHKEKISHSALFDGTDLYESTISGGVSGPQRSVLDERVAEYRGQGGHAWLFPFLPQFAPDWGRG
jgi:hypothetical protein